MITWQEWCYIIGGYLSGSILYSYLLPKALKGIDITAESPDGNPGTANAFTCAGIPIGILVLCMELLKGYLPVHLALREVNPARWSFALILAAPVFGHACPFLQPQKGGKAIAVSFGVLLGLVPFWLPVLSLAALYLIFSLVIVIDPHFYRSVCTFVLFSVSIFCRVSMTVPREPVDGIYGERTKEAVRQFQSVFGLGQTGVVDYPTWYKIQEIYVGITRIAELY